MFWQQSTLYVHISDFDKVMNQQLTTTPVKYILVGWLQVLQECPGVRMSHHEILHFFPFPRRRLSTILKILKLKFQQP